MANKFDQAGIRNRVTKEEIDNLIQRVDYHLFEETTVTACLIRLKNGAKVLGVNYGRILPEEQNVSKKLTKTRITRFGNWKVI